MSPDTRNNLYREADHKLKVCHRTIETHLIEPDWLDSKPVGAKCLGSACSAWRWRVVTDYDGTVYTEYEMEFGYCALLGDP